MNTQAVASAAALPAILATLGINAPELVNLGAGLVSVWVARLVFIDRENRRLQRRQAWRETVPVTLVAMLIAGAFIRQNDLSMASAIYTGLGVGWVAVVLLDLLGQKVTDALRAALGGGPADPRLPPVVDTSGNDGRVVTADADLADLTQTPPGGGPSIQDMLDNISDRDDERKGRR